MDITLKEGDISELAVKIIKTKYWPHSKYWNCPDHSHQRLCISSQKHQYYVVWPRDKSIREYIMYWTSENLRENDLSQEDESNLKNNCVRILYNTKNDLD